MASDLAKLGRSAASECPLKIERRGDLALFTRRGLRGMECGIGAVAEAGSGGGDSFYGVGIKTVQFLQDLLY